MVLSNADRRGFASERGARHGVLLGGSSTAQRVESLFTKRRIARERIVGLCGLSDRVLKDGTGMQSRGL